MNSDSENARMERGENQFEFEDRFLTESPGKSIVDRFFEIRDEIFSKYETIAGEPYDRILSDRLDVKEYKRDALPTTFSAFVRFIDQIEEENMGLKDSEFALRLGVLTYFGGIINHNTIDGNGQTYRLIALSYIREFGNDQYNESYFPIKYDQDYGVSGGISPFRKKLFRVNDEDSTELLNTRPPLEILPEKLRRLLDLVDKFDKEYWDIVLDFDYKSIEDIDNKKAQLLDDFLNSLVDLDTKYANFLRTRSEKESFFMDLSRLTGYILRTEFNERYPGYFFNELHVGPAELQIYVLKICFDTDEGLKFIRSYLDGSLQEKELSNPWFTRILHALRKLESDFRAVLESETKEVHDGKHAQRKL